MKAASKGNEGTRTGMRRALLWILFSTVLLIPTVMRLRRRRSLWNGMRLAMGAAGAGILAFGLLVKGSHWWMWAGGVLMALGATIGPERRKVSTNDRARELGALLILDGGRCCPPDEHCFDACIFVGTDRMWILDKELTVRYEFLFNKLEFQLEASEADWKLRLADERSDAELQYEGTFAEHLARVVESTLQGRMRRELPVLP